MIFKLEYEEVLIPELGILASRWPTERTGVHRGIGRNSAKREENMNII